MAVTVASKVPFHQFAALLEKINGLSGTDAKKKQLKDFVEEWRSFHKRLHADEPNEVMDFKCFQCDSLRRMYILINL